jgi:hypothetical protein
MVRSSFLKNSLSIFLAFCLISPVMAGNGLVWCFDNEGHATLEPVHSTESGNWSQHCFESNRVVSSKVETFESINNPVPGCKDIPLSRNIYSPSVSVRKSLLSKYFGLMQTSSCISFSYDFASEKKLTVTKSVQHSVYHSPNLKTTEVLLI